MPATLEDLRPIAAERHEDGEFIDLGWRPVFKEHTNTRDFDKPVRFNRQAMEDIAERCNRRITEDNDYCPLVIRHTKDDGSFDPEVVGLAGPFKAQKLKSGKWAVYAKYRLYKEDANKSRKYPRVSVEYWADKANPTDGYFDPISMLGAETPELDLGVHYQADPNDSSRQLIRYSKLLRFEAAPGGSNTFAPDGCEKKPKRFEADDESNDQGGEEPSRYQAGGTLSSGDIQQIIAALKSVIDEAVDAKVAALQPVGADPDNLLTDEAPAGELPGDMTGSPEAGDVMGPTDDELNFGDDAGADETDKPGDDDTDTESTPEIDDELPKKKPAKFSAHGRDSQTVSLDEESDMAAENAEVVRYQKEAADYRKKHDDLLVKYQKAETENTALKGEVTTLKAEKTKAIRYSKLNELHGSGIVFDLASETKDCEDMNDQQFERHVERIKSNYQRVPGMPGFVKDGKKIDGPARTDSDDRADARKRTRYAKLAGDNVLAGRKEGKAIEFKPEFERLMSEDPEKIGNHAA